MSVSLGDKGNRWLLTRVNIPPQSKDWNIILQATTDKGTAGDVAIDDFNLLDGKCNGAAISQGQGRRVLARF